MKIVTIIARTEIAGALYFPGIGVVSDAVATALDDLSALSGTPIDYRPPNPFSKMVFRGAYDADTAYVNGDVVTDSGSTYVAIQDSVGEDVADNTDFFIPFQIEGESSELIDLLGAIPIPNVPALGTTSNLSALVPAAASPSASGVTLTTAGGNTYSDADVKAAIDAAVDALKDKIVTALGAKADNVDAETLRTQVEARLDALDAQADAIVSGLVTAKVMEAP